MVLPLPSGGLADHASSAMFSIRYRLIRSLMAKAERMDDFRSKGISDLAMHDDNRRSQLTSNRANSAARLVKRSRLAKDRAAWDILARVASSASRRRIAAPKS